MSTVESICIIDDDPIFVYGAKRMLKEAGFCNNSVVYDNGNDALTGLTEMSLQSARLPAIIFLDLNMPIMNGWDFLEEFVKLEGYDPLQTAIYVISSSVDPRDLIRIKETKAISDYILKPLTADDIHNILTPSI